MPTLILASTSPYRRELLARFGIPFETLAPDVDETLRPDETAQAAALRLAADKAKAVSTRRPDAFVLAGDQLASLDGEPIGKPRDAAEAERRLMEMSGRTLLYCTAIALFAPHAAQPVTFLDETTVHLRRYDKEEVQRYLARENPLDCAGGLKLERSGAALCEIIETTDPTALIGLPLIAVARLLRTAGYPLP